MAEIAEKLDEKLRKLKLPIPKEKFKEFHRYLYRPTTSYKHAKMAQRHVISKGFKKSFIVAYVNGKRTSAWEVARMSNNN